VKPLRAWQIGQVISKEVTFLTFDIETIDMMTPTTPATASTIASPIIAPPYLMPMPPRMRAITPGIPKAMAFCAWIS